MLREENRLKILKGKRLFQSEMDLTSGNLLTNIWLYTLPLLLTSLLQLLYTSADLVVVANFGGGRESMSAVGANGSLINLIVTFFLGLSVGLNVVLANAKGAKDKEKASKCLHSGMLLSVIGGVIVGVFGFFSARSLLEIMHTPVEYIDRSEIYLKWYFAAIPFVMIFNFGSAALRAMGDSKRPFYSLLGCGLLNVILNLLLVIVFHLDVKGVAIATFISEGVEAGLIVLFLVLNKKGFVCLSFKEIRFNREETFEMLRIGIPAGFQSLVFSISNVAIQAEANSFGANVINGNTASNNIEGYLYALLNSFSVAVTAVVAQNFGAGKKENIRKTFKIAIFSVVALGLVVGGILALLRKPLLDIFLLGGGAGEQSAESYAESFKTGSERCLLMCLTYFTCGVMDSCSAYLLGLKYSILPTLVSFVGACLLRLAFIFIVFRNFPYFHTVLWLYASYPLTWLTTDIIYFLIIPHFEKRAFSKIKEEEPVKIEAIPLPH